MFSIKPLPYSYNALEPYVDAETMELHYEKHHKTYLNNLNKLTEKYPQLYNKDLENLLTDCSKIPLEIKQDFINQGGGVYNHGLFWSMMKADAKIFPNDFLIQKICSEFGSFAQFKNLFSEQAKLAFGSSWVWLVLNSNSKLKITTTDNQDCPLSNNEKPILALDLWEHAYYLKYQNKRFDYVAAWWNVINWDFVEAEYKRYINS